MEDPSRCCHVGGCVSESKGEVMLCDHYGIGVLGAGVVWNCFPFLLCQSANLNVDGVAVERFSVLGSSCFFL